MSREAVSLKKSKRPLFNVLEVEGYAENLQLITQNWNFSIYTEYYAEFYTEWSAEYYTVFDTEYHVKCIST